MSHKPPKDLPTPTLGQPHRAGDSERIGTSRIGYLAPLPLPTGMPAVDHANAIGEMNDVWLDYGAGPSRVLGWQGAIGAPFGISLFFIVIIPAVLWPLAPSKEIWWETAWIFWWAALWGGARLP